MLHNNVNKIYSFEEMETLINKITRIKKKKNLEEIRDIIISCNPSISVTENSNGIFMHFNKLKNETYHMLNKYMKNYQKEKDELSNSNKISDNCDSLQLSDISSDDMKTKSTDKDKNNISKEGKYIHNSRLKYNNKEKNIIKRKIYDKELQESNSENISNDTLFIKNNNSKINYNN